MTDPADELQWLISILQYAENNQEKVVSFITVHCSRLGNLSVVMCVSVKMKLLNLWLGARFL